MKRQVLCGAVLAIAGTAAASVFDDARLWWKFDNGGADGAVVQASEIHDARNPSAAVPTAVNCGPTWSRMDVRLPTQRKTVNSTALYLKNQLRYTTTNQFYQANLTFSNIQVDSKDITVVARIMFDGNDVGKADCVLFNNGYNWTSMLSQAFGFIKGSSVTGPTAVYYPYIFAGRAYPGGGVDKKLALTVGQWYDVAYSVRYVQYGDVGTNYVTFVVSSDKGLLQQSIEVASNYADGSATTTTRIGSMGSRTDWTNYSPSISKNDGDTYKNFSGWVHQLAVWDRPLTVDEIKEAFGEPVRDACDVYADAVHWWKFDRDINGDGNVQTNEVRDVRHWGGTNANAYARAHVVPNAMGGPFGGPQWQNTSVYLPARGVTVQSPCMDFPIVTNVSVNASGDTIYSAWLTRLDMPRAAISGSSTVIARIRPQIHYGALPGVYGYFYNNGLDWGNWSGYEVGLARNGNGASGTSGTNLILGICIAHSSYYFGNLTLVTNEWYDVAFIVNDAGKDVEGHDLTDSVTAVLCSKAHGFKSQTQNISTNAYTTYKTYGQIRIGGEGGYSAPVDYYNATTKAAITNANGTKSFNGQIHQVAVWDRALTLDEVAAAFGHPNNMVMGVGIADGTSGEFAADGEGSRDWTLNEAWHDMAASVDAAHPDLTIRFTPAANNVELVHALHLRTATVGTGNQKAVLTLKVNGRALASDKEVGSNEDLWMMMGKRALTSGVNTLTITYKGGPAASVAIDKVEINGSWQVGADNGNNFEFSQEGSGRGNDFYVGNRHLPNMVRSLTSGNRNTYIHFYIPPEIATNHSYTFTSRYDDETSATTTTNSFRILLNDVEKYRSPVQGLNKGTPIAFEVDKGELLPGWNTLNQQFVDSSGWMTFDYFYLGISDYNPGTILLIR